MIAEDAIRDGVAALFERGHVVEVRALKTARGTASGYFDAAEALMTSVRQLDEQHVPAIYATINPVVPALLARSANRVTAYARDTTQDAHIVRRSRLLIDLDARRPSGISATDVEHEAALARAVVIRECLRKREWPEPLYVDSGNGAHLIYPIDLPNDADATRLVRDVLRVLAERFDDDVVEVDQSVHNAARIVKIPGTWARKGDDLPERPHRRSSLIDVPPLFGADIVTTMQLASLVADLAPRRDEQRTTHDASFDLEAFLVQHMAVKRGPEPYDGGERWIVECPFDSTHGGTSSAVLRLSSGALVYKCQHNGCRDRRWGDVRERYEPGYDGRRESSATSSRTHKDHADVVWDDSRPWPLLDRSALYGPAGEFVRGVAPNTEADPAALLFTVLAAVGNIAGGNVNARIHDDRHPARLFVVLVGKTSSGGKGTSYAVVRPLLRRIDESWFESRTLGGFGSGEAVVTELGATEDVEGGEIDPVDPVNPVDPRLLVVEREFARVLAVAGRDGSTLSMILRDAWDGAPLQARRSKTRVVAKNHHVSAIAHITPHELRESLRETEMSNGFANRFLFVASHRSQKLPFGGVIPEQAYDAYGALFKHAIGGAPDRVITFAEDARAPWAALYNAEEDRDGLTGDLTARSASQRLRLATAYAALDGDRYIRAAHVFAAEACWRYSVATVEHIFGDMRGDRTQDRLLAAAREAYPEGLTSVDVDRLFTKSVSAQRIGDAREALIKRNLLRKVQTPSGPAGGRPTMTIYAIPLAGSTGLTGSTVASHRVNPVDPVDPVVEADNVGDGAIV